MRIRAFQGLRPPPDQADKVASLPYDVVSTDEARELARGNPISMYHVIRPEIDLPDGTDPHSDAVYAKAVENLKRLQDDGALAREDKPVLYVYRQQMGEHIQHGVVGVCHYQDYLDDKIKKHEKTRPDKEDDRTRMTSELSANPGPVFLTYKDEPKVSALVQQVVAGEPLFDFTPEDGIRHTAWRVDDPEQLVKAFGEVPCFYVADGHHRSASAARVGAERAKANPDHTGEEDYNWFLCVTFPGSELQILPYNRVIHDLNGRNADEFLAALKEITPVTENADPSPKQAGHVSMYLAGKWYGLEFKPSEDADPVSRLDVQMLQERVLAPLLGIDDPRTSNRITFAGGIRGTDYLVKQVEAGKGAVAFSMYPVSIEQLIDISDAGQIMAPKSTWFEPKLRSGLFVHTF